MSAVAGIGRRRAPAWVWALVLVGTGVLIAANVHLVVVAIQSQPDCAIAKSETGAHLADYQPAKAAC